MKGLPRLSLTLLRAWTGLYTLALDSELRQRRRELVEADAWDQIEDARQGGESPPLTALSLLLRLLRGVPADLSWRLSAGSATTEPVVLSYSPRRQTMNRKDSLLLAACLAGLGWALVLVLLLAPTEHSLAYAGGVLALVALAGWTIEARLAGEGSASAWPLLLTLAIGSVGAGLLIESSQAGMVVALPLALLASRSWVTVAFSLDTSLPSAGPQPVDEAVLQQHVMAGDAIAIESWPARRLSRRSILRGGVWLGVTSVLAASMSAAVDFLWNRSPEAFGGVVLAGDMDRFPPGSKTKIQAGKFWLVNLTAEQGGPGYLALWQKCPHLGCTVPWEPSFVFKEPGTGVRKKGWFRCPCHQSTYNDAGVRVYGPAPRSMDRMEVMIDSETGRISVDTGRISRGAEDNADYAVPAPV